MSRSRENRPRGSRKQQTKITFAARARTLNRFKKIIMGHRDSLSQLILSCQAMSSCCYRNKAKITNQKHKKRVVLLLSVPKPKETIYGLWIQVIIMLLFQMLKPFADLKNENKNIIKNRTNVYIHVQLSDNLISRDSW